MPGEQMLQTSDPKNLLAAGAAGLFGIWSLYRFIMRRMSRDSVETAKDRAEINITETLQEQLREALAENTTLRRQAMEAGHLSAKVEMMTATIEQLKQQVEGLNAKMAEQNELVQRLTLDNAKLITELEHAQNDG